MQPDPYVSVIVLEFNSRPEAVEGLVARTIDGGYALNYQDKFLAEGDGFHKGPRRYGTVPEHVLAEGKYEMQWKIYVDRPGRMTVDASYSFQAEKPGGRMMVKAAGHSLRHTPEPTGLTVGEHNRDWHIDNFKSHRIGTLEFPDKGIYEITLEIDPGKDEPLEFQWLWLKAE
jgi:alpha-L-fucosidase